MNDVIPQGETAETVDNTDAVLRMLGLARRARKLAVGTDAVLNAVRSSNKPFIVVSACDVSERTAKQLTDKCLTYGVPLVTLKADRSALAAALGSKDGQTSACAVTDRNMAIKIDHLIK
jgi:ribosomal protein L7Ae-like RNA K-turn-binding protein